MESSNVMHQETQTNEDLIISTSPHKNMPASTSKLISLEKSYEVTHRPILPSLLVFLNLPTRQQINEDEGLFGKRTIFNSPIREESKEHILSSESNYSDLNHTIEKENIQIASNLKNTKTMTFEEVPKKLKSSVIIPVCSVPKKINYKRLALKFLKQGHSCEHISILMGIDLDIIKGWNKNRLTKALSGRKRIDPNMEVNLLIWIHNNFQKNSNIQSVKIREKAMEMSDVKSFKGSKGWLARFVNRHKLKLFYNFI